MGLQHRVVLEAIAVAQLLPDVLAAIIQEVVTQRQGKKTFFLFSNHLQRPLTSSEVVVEADQQLRVALMEANIRVSLETLGNLVQLGAARPALDPAVVALQTIQTLTN